jgi:ATPase subunit of ABC transporter with duplicated ATPase domains
MIEKLKVEDVKPSSRQYPFIRFIVDPREKLHRGAVEAKGLFYGKLDLTIEAGEKVAIIGPNGVGKTTLLRSLLPEGAKDRLQLDAATVKWAEKARLGYWPQDVSGEFKLEETLTEWMTRWRRKGFKQDDLIVRATLGQLLFSGEDQKKTLKVISGGEGQRMIIGRLILDMPNVLLLDEPTNHLDMESIESLNTALDKYTGTLVLVSHDRELISSLATRVVELKPDGTAVDFRGGYEEYLTATGTELAAA